jgi:hypothetical protein
MLEVGTSIRLMFHSRVVVSDLLRGHLSSLKPYVFCRSGFCNISASNAVSLTVTGIQLPWEAHSCLSN